MREPAFWQKNTGLSKVWSALLAPFAWLYAAVIVWRIKHTTPQRAPLPLLCVGNFTLGGNGKTPTALYVANRLAALGEVPAVLLRGFGGTCQKEALRVRPDHSIYQVGDEALMLCQHFPTYVGADRSLTMVMAQADGATVLIKDDGFQNPHLSHDYNLIVIDAATGFGNGRVFPAGPLREPLRHAWQRVDAVLLIDSHTPQDPRLSQLPDDRPCFHGHFVSQTKPPPRAFAFCGIAKPQKFIDPLKKADVLVGQRIFDDHHVYSEKQAYEILKAAQAMSATPVTTAKDFVRLKDAPRGSARFILSQSTQVINISLTIKEATQFDSQIKSLLCKNRATSNSL